MKKIIFVLLIILGMAAESYSQSVEKKMKLKNEIYSAYGFGSIQEIASAFSDMFGVLFSFTDGDYNVTGIGGPVMLGYKRVIDKNVGVGILASYTQFNSEYIKKRDKSVVFSTTNRFYALMMKLDIYYVLNEWVQMSSGGSFGIMNGVKTTRYPGDIKPYESIITIPAFQINAFSLRVGKSIGGFFEIGVGVNGFFDLGVSYKF